MNIYTPSLLKEEFNIKKLYSVHYFEYSTDYNFPGESHGFWEMVYVDKGSANIVTPCGEFVLSQGSVTFHKPHELHGIYVNNSAPNVAIISFECKSPSMCFFEDKVFSAGQKQKEFISKIISEFTRGFETPLNQVICYKLSPRENAFFGAEQLIKNYISELLISFIRGEENEKQFPQITKNNYDVMLGLIVDYMHENIGEKIRIKDLTDLSSFNKVTVTNLFKRSFGKGPIDYFIDMKIERAKLLLREKNYNITQISELLGYSSIHFFSRQFKIKTGMSPEEYSNSIKALI